MNTARIVILAHAANTGLSALYRSIAAAHFFDAGFDHQPNRPDRANLVRRGTAMRTIQK